MVEIVVIGGPMPQEERHLYVEYIQEKYHRKLERLKIKVIGDEVELSYKFAPVRFERIRRITGYLTGDTASWNDAKKHELEDRVTHGGMVSLTDEDTACLTAENEV
jgi:hypothetical protein